MIRGKRTYSLIGIPRRSCNSEKIGCVVARNKHEALLKALLKDENIKQKVSRYYWDTIRVEIS